MWKISIHLSPVIYSKNQLNLRDSSSIFLMTIYQSLCRPEKPLFLKVQHTGLKRVLMRISTFQWVDLMALKCELVGTYTQSKLTNIMNKEDVGLYRYDGLGIFRNIARPEIERKKKGIVKVFKKCGLSIVVDTNLKTVDFLDVTFDLDKNIYKPYRKPNNSSIYINKNSNYPPDILKQLPKSIAKRISETSSSEEIFNKSIKTYSKALKESGFTDELK